MLILIFISWRHWPLATVVASAVLSQPLYKLYTACPMPKITDAHAVCWGLLANLASIDADWRDMPSSLCLPVLLASVRFNKSSSICSSATLWHVFSI